LDEDDSDESEEVEGGIFDEDISWEEASDFNIKTTLLTAAPAVESWAGQNLEQSISRDFVEKDWGDEDKFEGGEIYRPSESGSSDFYGGAAGGGDFYGAGSGGSDLYKESGSGGADVYNTGQSSGKSSNGLYAPGKESVGSYDELRDKRRGGRSMLEISGYEDPGKKDQRDLRSDVQYDSRDAA